MVPYSIINFWNVWKLPSHIQLCNPMDCSLPGSSVHGILQGKNTRVGCHFFLQEIFPIQNSYQIRSDQSLSHVRLFATPWIDCPTHIHIYLLDTLPTFYAPITLALILILIISPHSPWHTHSDSVSAPEGPWILIFISDGLSNGPPACASHMPGMKTLAPVSSEWDNISHPPVFAQLSSPLSHLDPSFSTPLLCSSAFP